MRALTLAAVLAALLSCKREPSEDTEREKPAKTTTPKASASAAPQPQPAAESSGPRYLRPDRAGVLVDAFTFPSVPASIIEQEVAGASSPSEAASVLRRFGLPALKGKSGQVWMGQASLVDRLARERVLVVSFHGDTSGEGLRDEDAWIVFLGSTHDERLLKIGNARVTTKATADPGMEVDARELHSKDADDVVATWSSCAKPFERACNSLRAWTMQRGYPELILDVTGDDKPAITGASPPHDVVVDGRVLKFDAGAFKYR